MSFKVEIGFNAEALLAITALTEAIRSIGVAAAPVATVTSTTTVKAAKAAKAAETTEEEEGPFFWADNSTGFFGKVDTKAEYDKLKKKDSGVYRIPEDTYKAKLAEHTAKQEEDRKAKQAAKSEPKKAAKAESASAPTVQDLIDTFAPFLPKDLDEETRKERRAFVAAILKRLGGVAKASELAEGDRALAINLVQRKAAGEDVDPETDDFAEVGSTSDDEDLV